MSFVSLSFLIFFPVVLVAYHLGHGRARLQNGLLVAASLFFYGWWDWRFLGLLAFTTGVDFVAAQVVERSPRWRREALVVSVGTNLATLGLFKYADFFLRSLVNLGHALGAELPLAPLGLLLPVGVSFYTFQSIAYVVDVYRGEQRAERDPMVYFAFVTFFPQLVAGPIERARHMLPQFRRPRILDRQGVADALLLVASGYLLKVVVADSLAPFVDSAFRNDQVYGWSTVLGSVAFGFQIFGDFCGYSLIAKGVAALLGFELAWNFRQPYLAVSPSDFWRRWHVSLSEWLRDYLYKPLGGSRHGLARTVANLMAVMVLGGLWHGASWTFLLWGALHGVALAAQHLGRAWAGGRWKVPAVLGWAATLAVVQVGWFLFRAPSAEAMRAMVAALGNWSWTPGHGELAFTLALLAGPVMAVEAVQRWKGQLVAWLPAAVRPPVVAAAALLVLALADVGRSRFIYFQF